MKNYVLRTTQSNDNAPAFVQKAMSWAKATNELFGIIRGVLIDQRVSETEAMFLKSWIVSRPELMCDPLVAQLANRLVRVCEDGIVTEAESDELKILFSSFLGDPEQEVPTDLPLDNPPPKIQIKDSLFCFTGTFVSGTRNWCHEQIERRGGRISDDVYMDVHYLVIGSKVSKAWINQSYGRKIEAAVGIKKKLGVQTNEIVGGSPISIIAEDHWLKHL